MEGPSPSLCRLKFLTDPRASCFLICTESQEVQGLSNHLHSWSWNYRFVWEGEEEEEKKEEMEKKEEGDRGGRGKVSGKEEDRKGGKRTLQHHRNSRTKLPTNAPTVALYIHCTCKHRPHRFFPTSSLCSVLLIRKLCLLHSLPTLFKMTRHIQ